VGAIYTRTNFVTLKYVTDAWGTNANGFRLVITAVKDPSEYLSICEQFYSPITSPTRRNADARVPGKWRFFRAILELFTSSIRCC